MFHKLRNKFILFNFGITTVVVVVVFSAIYFTAAHSASRRPPDDRIPAGYTNDVRTIVTKTIEDERKDASRELLTILIISGISIEICVIIISYFLAEIAIKPVKEAYNSQKLFIANASHEIKTPLAAISANLEAANLSSNKWIKNVEEETKKITTLNNSLLNLARTDLITTSAETTKEDLKKLIESELGSLAPRLSSKSKPIKLTKNLDPEVKNINKTDFRETIGILLDNAVKYCDSRIEVSLNQSKITVKNDGSIIPKEQLPHVFDRFYQVDKSAEGVGLGLSIAAALAERNNWTLSANTEGDMNIFTLTI